MKSVKYLLFILVATILLTSYPPQNGILTDAATATGINEETFIPIGITSTFPKDTLKVFCWFKWENCRINAPISATWYYVTDNICIITHTFKITRKDGSGSVSLAMPQEKTLPSGSYRVDLKSGRRLLKSVNFTVE